jgi:hypothetical protein
MARRVPQERSVTSAIRQLLERDPPHAYCDACLAFHLGVSLATARTAALTLAGEPGFRRHQGGCNACHRAVELTSMSMRGQRP